MSADLLREEHLDSYRRTKHFVYLAAMLMDLCVGVFFFVGPVLAFRLTDKPGLQGVLGIMLLGARILFNALFGRLSDWLGRKKLLLVSASLMMVVFLGLRDVPNLYVLYTVAFVVGVANALYWPVIEAWVGEEVSGRDLVRDIGSYNIFFSMGLALGPLVSAVLQYWSGGTDAGGDLFAPILFGLGLAVAILLFIILRPALTHDQLAELRRRQALAPASPRSRRFLYAGWLANFVAWCGVGIVRFLLPALTDSLSLGESTLGILWGVFYGSWTLGFVVWRSWTGWPYRQAPLLLNQLIGAAGLGCLWLARDAVTLGVGLALFGLGVTGPYVSSIFYGLDRYWDKGTKSGLHETVLAGGMLLGLVAASALAQWVDVRAPYLLTMAATMIAVIFERYYLRPRPSSPRDS